VVGLEVSAAAVADAERSLADLPRAQVRRGDVQPASVNALATELGGIDLVVLDPPRSGAGAAVMTVLLDLRPRRIAYVACDPASLARDLRTAFDAGWSLSSLRAFDAFPMTQHVECISILEPPAA
jgi:tRNA/tmRNA/rRNA uracil-C5-methylase (TrmA/RlmC/RlmD family)